MVIVREIRNLSTGNKSLFDLLPVEVLSEILFRLHVRSVLSCRCICKSFNKLTRSPAFIANHVSRNSTSSTNTSCSVNIYVIDENFKERCEHILIETEDDYVLSTSHVRESNPLTTHISIIGSCNGLFCACLDISDEQWGSRIMLWNPVTRDNRFLLKPKIDAPNFPVIEFGFVPKSNEYKVVRFITYYTSRNKDIPSPGDVFVMQIEVYKMSTDSNVVPCYGPDCMSLEIDPFSLLKFKFGQSTGTLFVNGAFHWLAVNPKNGHDPCAAIVTFNLETELKLISLLESHRILYAKKGQLEIMNDLLGLIVPHNPKNIYLGFDFDIWAMNDYGDRESWTKQYIAEQFDGFARPCGYWKNNLLLMAETDVDNSLFFYNLHTEEREDILDYEQFNFEHFCSYVETLVPVSKRNAVAENGG